MLLAVPRGQALPAGGKRGVVPIRKVMERPFIGYDDDSSLGLLVRQTLARHALEPHSTLEVQTYSLALALVDAGLGLTLLDEYTALSANPGNVALHDVQPELGFEIQMLRASHRGASSLVDDMHAQFAAAADTLAATLNDRLEAPVVQFDPVAR